MGKVEEEKYRIGIDKFDPMGPDFRYLGLTLGRYEGKVEHEG